MRLSKEWVYRLNFLLPLYRKYLHLTQKDVYFHQDTNKWLISPVTIHKVERRKTYVKEKVLPLIYTNLKVPICISSSLDEVLDEEMYHLYIYMEKDEIDNACTTMNVLLQMLEKYNSYAYYHECYYFLKKLYNYYKKGISIKEEDYQSLFQIVSLFTTNGREILLDFLYIYASGSTQEKLLHLMNTYDYSSSMYIPNQINYANQLYERGNRLMAYSLLIEIEPKVTKLGSKQQLGYIYVILSSIALHIDVELCKVYLGKMEDMLSLCEDNKNTQGMLLLNLANRYLILDKYDLVEKFTKKYLDIFTNRHYEHNIVYLCYCARMSNSKINKYWFEESKRILDDQLTSMLFQYYEGIERGTEKNMKFLMKQVRPYLSAYDQTYMKIVRDELYMLSKKSGSYISYVKFLEEYKSVIFSK